MENRRLTSFYTLTDFEIAHKEIVDIWIQYKETKHHMTVAQLCNTRDEITILGGQIADMDVDLYYDYAMLKTRTRRKELEEREKLEIEYRAKSVTGAADKARYKAEMLVSADKEEEALAKAIHLRAYNLYSFSIPEMLRAIASRLNALIRTMPIGAPPTTETTEMPSMHKFNHDEDNFEAISRRHGFSAADDIENDLDEDFNPTSEDD